MTPPSKQLDDKALEAAEKCAATIVDDAADGMTAATGIDPRGTASYAASRARLIEKVSRQILPVILEHAPASRNAVWNEAIEAAAKVCGCYLVLPADETIPLEKDQNERERFAFAMCARFGVVKAILQEVSALRLPKRNEKDQGR